MPKRPKREPPRLDGWPPSIFCPHCLVRSYSPREVRDGYCVQCKRYLRELLQADAAHQKTLSEAQHRA